MSALEGATVLIMKGIHIETIGITDANGAFWYMLTAGTYDIYVISEGMATIHKTVTVLTNEELVVNMTTPSIQVLGAPPTETVSRSETVQIDNAPPQELGLLPNETALRQETITINNEYLLGEYWPTGETLSRQEAIQIDNVAPLGPSDFPYETINRHETVQIDNGTPTPFPPFTYEVTNINDGYINPTEVMATSDSMFQDEAVSRAETPTINNP